MSHSSHSTAPATATGAANKWSAMHDAVEHFALAGEILDELAGDSHADRPVTRTGILSVLNSIGVRDPRAVAAVLAKDALERTAVATAELPDELADVVLEDVVRTARLIDQAAEA